MVSFAGFEMPMWYKGIIPEHMAVRNAVDIFDVLVSRTGYTGEDGFELFAWNAPCRTLTMP